MFKNPGKSIQIIASILFVIMLFCSVVGGIVSCDHLKGISWIIVISGVIVAFVTCLLLSGFGELIENSEYNKQIANDVSIIKGTLSQMEMRENNNNDKVEKLNKLLEEGLITKDEYIEILSGRKNM